MLFPPQKELIFSINLLAGFAKREGLLQKNKTFTISVKVLLKSL